MRKGKSQSTTDYGKEAGSLYEKHMNAAKAAEQRGDWVEAESFYQKADHCLRTLESFSGSVSCHSDEKTGSSQLLVDESHAVPFSRGQRAARRGGTPSWNGYLRQNRRKPFKNKSSYKNRQTCKEGEVWNGNASE